MMNTTLNIKLDATAKKSLARIVELYERIDENEEWGDENFKEQSEKYMTPGSSSCPSDLDVNGMITAQAERGFYYHLFHKQDIVAAKQFLYLSGRITEIDICAAGDKEVLRLNIKYAVLLLLSDNKELIHRFAYLQVEDYEGLLKYGSWVACMQAALRDDYDFIRKHIPIAYKNDKAKSTLEYVNFFEGLIEGDIAKMENALTILSNRLHKRLHDESFTRDLLSLYPMGFAKLAWLKGYEVNVESKFIVPGLLPINPNTEYWELEFMQRKEYQCKRQSYMDGFDGVVHS